MSIGSVMSNTWTPPFRQGSTDSSVLAAASTPPPDASGTVQGNDSTAWFSPTTLPTGPSTLGAADPFQQLSSDIQALLVQAQGGTATQAASTTGTATSAASGAVGANAIGATAAADPEQQLATDLQSLLAQLQSTDAGSGQNGQTAGTGQVQPHHHHHHHHHQGGGQEATTAASGTGGATTASPTTASSAATSSGTAASGSDQMLSNTLAADIMQALQAYGSTTPAAIGPALTA